MTTVTLSLDDLKRREAELTRVTRRRNTREYVVGGVAAAFLLVMSLLTFAGADAPADVVIASGFATLAAGSLLAGWLLFRGSRPVADDLAANGRDHLQSRLERERKLLSTAWLWYIGPMLPGFGVTYLGFWMDNPEHPVVTAIAGGLTLLFLVAVALANRHAARGIERQILDLRD